jgi:hypothetical protein
MWKIDPSTNIRNIYTCIYIYIYIHVYIQNIFQKVGMLEKKAGGKEEENNRKWIPLKVFSRILISA